MNWVEFIWFVIGGACVALCGVYLLVWLQRRHEPEHLSLALVAAGVSAMALLEPVVLQARTPAEFEVLARWFHVPVAVFVVATVLFVRLRYGVGSRWLGSVVIGLRLASLVANFTTGVNVNFIEVSALTRTSWLGTEVVIPQGTTNPWMVLASMSLLLLACFLLHAAWELWQRKAREDRLRGTAILLATVAFLLVVSIRAILVATGILEAPFLVTPLFAGVVLALGFDLGKQVLRVPDLVQSLAQSEAGRHAGEVQLQMVDAASGLGTWSWSYGDEHVQCSDGALAMLDLPPGLPVDRTRLARAIPPEYRASLRKAHRAAVDGSRRFREEFCINLDTGGTRWLMAVGNLEDDAGGNPSGVTGVLIDITQRHDADERFRRLVETAPLAILLVDGNGRIAFANRSAESLFGYTGDELVAMAVEDLVPPARRCAHQLERANFGEQPASRPMGLAREVCGLRKDGSEVPIDVSLSPMPAGDGQQVLVIINDISRRKQDELEAGSRRQELAHLSRVALLAELSGSLAHELNQPLTAILSNAQAGVRFLERDPPDLGEVRESLRNIVESDKRAGEIIRRLRAMLRKDPPDFQHLDPNEVIADVLHIVHSDLVGRNVDVRLQLQAGLPKTPGDRVQLQQVLLNLILNGCDAMAMCPRQAVLTIRSRSLRAGWIGIDVVDGGSGIPADDLERIFLPFVSSKGDGLGLGLAVCRTIVQAHEGALWAENNIGPGATLHLELRAVDTDPGT